MKNHSMIFDDFFKDPRRAKALINMQEMKDIPYVDGVTYPNIAQLPPSVHQEMCDNLRTVVGPAFKEVISFARYSFESTHPPHWAHSDHEIAQFLALIYLNESEELGTCCLKHSELGFETHPQTDFHKQVLISHANYRQEWEQTFVCPGRFNRCLILNTELIHAAVGQFGSTRDDGRLVISVFFNLEQS